MTRKPVAMNDHGTIVVCDDGTVWQWYSTYGNLKDQDGQWCQRKPIPGTLALAKESR